MAEHSRYTTDCNVFGGNVPRASASHSAALPLPGVIVVTCRPRGPLPFRARGSPTRAVVARASNPRPSPFSSLWGSDALVGKDAMPPTVNGTRS